MKIKNLLFYLALSITFTTTAQTTVGPIISTDQVWTAAGSPYLISNNTLIDSGVSVKVMPGAEIQGSSVQLQVDGEFQLLGNADSIVYVSGLLIKYTKEAVDYNSATGEGAFINYADIKGEGVAKMTIDVTTTSLKVTNSYLYNGYYAIYFRGSSTEANTLDIDNSTLSGVIGSGNYYQGTILHVSGNLTHTNITNSELSYARAADIRGGTYYVHKNHYLHLEDIVYMQQKDAEISCNLYEHIRSGIVLDLRGNSNSYTLDFTDNTLDSFTARISYDHMLTIQNFGNGSVNPTLNISNNNFLVGDQKVRVYGYNSDPATHVSIDLTSNYWNTTDTSKIDSFISDYADNINVYGLVDYSGYLTNALPLCINILPCPTPAFSAQVNGTQVTFTDSVGAGGSRIWDFGDGSRDTTTSNSVSHTYSSASTFTACLYVLNADGVVCDSLCKEISTNEANFCSASYYVAKDTSIKFTMFIVNNSTKVAKKAKYLWEFGDGSTSTSPTPEHHYADFGNYELCLTITDEASSCNSQYCDTIGMDENGKYYKADGFSINVLDERDILSIQERIEGQIQVFPNPNNGNFKVSMNDAQNHDINVQVYNTLGMLVHNAEGTGSELQVELNNQMQGMYIAKITIDGYTTVRKINIEN